MYAGVFLLKDALKNSGSLLVLLPLEQVRHPRGTASFIENELGSIMCLYGGNPCYM
jgi:hypothetical protein